MKYNKLLILFTIWLSTAVHADVVKPALIEIVANTQGTIKIEIRASVEALLTGINSQYKNTKDAPNANDYDALRVLPPTDLVTKFSPFKTEFLKSISLKADQKKVDLQVEKIKIPEVGYPKVPRISVIYLTGKVSPYSENLEWFYPEKFGNNAVKVKQIDQKNQKWHWSDVQWLRNNQPSKPFSLHKLFKPEPLWHTITTYVELGVYHIIPKGLDHILFIISIFLLSTKLRPLLLQVTMFTIAHTITLGLAMHGFIEVPARIVEPLIALSIAYMATENIFVQKLHPHRLALVFAFGLLHGLGFASVLADFGMPSNAFVTALISFNVGVEFGQIAVILIAFFALAYWFKDKPWYRAVVVIPISIAIAVTGIYWALDRALII